MASEHTVKSFDDELSRLDNLVATMGGLAESQVNDSLNALTNRDVALADKIIAEDKRLDRLEEEINIQSQKLLALRHPVADDLRLVIAGLKVSSDLERIGDYAKNIAKRTKILTDAPRLGTSNSIKRMGGIVESMIRDVLDAYLARDNEKADDVRNRDEEVDALHSSLFRELLTYMMEDPRNISYCTHLLFVAKNIERMGDHVTNIAENVIFMVTGHRPDEARPKDDETPFTVVDGEGGAKSEIGAQ